MGAEVPAVLAEPGLGRKRQEAERAPCPPRRPAAPQTLGATFRSCRVRASPARSHLACPALHSGPPFRLQRLPTLRFTRTASVSRASSPSFPNNCSPWVSPLKVWLGSFTFSFFLYLHDIIYKQHGVSIRCAAQRSDSHPSCNDDRSKFSEQPSSQVDAK